jgi:hypothetical protein
MTTMLSEHGRERATNLLEICLPFAEVGACVLMMVAWWALQLVSWLAHLASEVAVVIRHEVAR